MAAKALLIDSDAISEAITLDTIQAGQSLKTVSIYLVAIAAYVPIMLYAARDLKSRRETLIAGYTSGVVFTLPLLCMHIAFLSRYPAVLAAEIPNGWIATEIMPSLFGDVFIIVLFIAILQTGVGLLQGFLERMDNFWKMRTSKPLGKKSHAGISTAVLIGCFLLSSLGVIELLSRMYSIIYWLSLPIFVLPLFTIGLYKLKKRPAIR